MESDVVSRIPPHDEDAEKCVIASMIVDREAASEISSILAKDDFYNKAYEIKDIRHIVVT